MKEVWVLSVKTSLPDVCFSSRTLETTVSAYDSFEKGREAMRKILRDFAFSKNSMFDGEGNIIQFKEYLDDSLEPDDDEEDCVDDFLISSVSSKIYDAIKIAISGKESDISKFNEYYMDGMIAIEFKNNSMFVYGDEDGPINGYDSNISTNIFSMKEEKDYFLYIDDMFGQECSSELYIDLQKAELK